MQNFINGCTNGRNNQQVIGTQFVNILPGTIRQQGHAIDASAGLAILGQQPGSEPCRRLLAMNSGPGHSGQAKQVDHTGDGAGQSSVKADDSDGFHWENSCFLACGVA